MQTDEKKMVFNCLVFILSPVERFILQAILLPGKIFMGLCLEIRSIPNFPTQQPLCEGTLPGLPGRQTSRFDRSGCARLRFAMMESSRPQSNHFGAISGPEKKCIGLTDTYKSSHATLPLVCNGSVAKR